ncbi:PilZ domain-containing protein [Rhizobium helianthi]|uniref:PilZ domain-containing protein n=1 Tax=Rhizobium helianthi TaxID=1132695 RepID=A0ABW4MB70_9HYPH
MLKGVQLVFNNGCSAINGVLRDVSDTGARVSVENSLALPQSISLVFEDGSKRSCEIARRELKEIGLRFTDL